MKILEQMRRGIERLIAKDSSIGIITRSVKMPGTRPGQQAIPTGETTTHKVLCRVSYQSGGVWPGKQWEGGLTIDTSPYVLARHDANLELGDILEWRGKRYTVGVVTRPDIDGGPVCTQAPLTEVK
jgi:hypothetical protein